MKTRIRDYGFIAWLKIKGYVIYEDFTSDLSVKELASLNTEYKMSDFFLFNQVLKNLVKGKK
jgi:hypothetical protein